MPKIKIEADEISAHLPKAYNDGYIKDTYNLIINQPETFDSLSYVYILDFKNALKAIVSLEEVLKLEQSTKWSEHTFKKPLYCKIGDSEEQIGLFALQHNLRSVPIVNHNQEFIGAVGSRAIFKIIDQEGVENVLKMGGISTSKNNKRFDSLDHVSLFLHRLPWLFIGLIGGLIISKIIENYEYLIAQNAILAAYLPLVIYLSDAVGTQNQAIAVRDLADINLKVSLRKYYATHIPPIILLAITLSILLWLFNYLLKVESLSNASISVALFASILSSMMASITVPFAMHKIKIDPANATGPLATVIQDTISVLIYFATAYLIIK